MEQGETRASIVGRVNEALDEYFSSANFMLDLMREAIKESEASNVCANAINDHCDKLESLIDQIADAETLEEAQGYAADIAKGLY